MSRVRWLTERISTITVKFSPFAVPCPYPVMLLSISSLLLEIPRHASLPARSSGERRIDRNQTFPKSPRLRRATIACNPAHLAHGALRAGCAGLQAIVARRNRGDFGKV